jgi:hypothetical protein
MSLRWFIYFSALFGSWAAFLGWVLGRLLSPESPVLQAGIKGMLLGVLVALSLGLIDALWNLPAGQLLQATLRVLTAVAVGGLGGLLGGMIGQVFFGWTEWSLFLIFGWTITGLLIGVSVGAFEVVAALSRGENLRAARRKSVNGLLGGTVGGFVGGILSVVLKSVWTGLFTGQPVERLWSPSAVGFVVLGLCIGLLIGLAQVVFREAWLRVEAGFRAGREMLLNKSETLIGRGEACDVGLFGDPSVEKQHARIQLQGEHYYLSDAGTASGTYLNETRIQAPALLHSGDRIRVGGAVLRFGERTRSQPVKAS